MINIDSVAIILFFHWLGDFVLQTDAQAKGKSKSNWRLSEHVMAYTATMFFCSLLVFKTGYSAIIWITLNGVLHWCTDWVTSRINSHLWAKGDVHNFFVSVGFDQLIHYFCLLLTFYHLRGAYV